LVDIELLEARLEVKFRDHMLLLSAITHRSYLNEVRRHPVPHNERLEFLGDAVLELVTTEYLYLHHHGSEGEMTKVRGLVANREHLNRVAEALGLGAFVLMSSGQARDRGRAYLMILGSCLEAIIGAMYFDKGYRVCQEFISRTVLVELPELVKNSDFFDPKSRLQEVVQEKLGLTPEYRFLEKAGPDHAKQFRFAVYAGRLELGRGIKFAPSKKEAQEEAARDALRKNKYMRSA